MRDFGDYTKRFGYNAVKHIVLTNIKAHEPDRLRPGDELAVVGPIADRKYRALNALSIANDLVKDYEYHDNFSEAVYTGAIYMVVTNLASTQESDYKLVPQPDTSAEDAEDAENAEQLVDEILSDKAAVYKAMTLAYATKVNWFLTDHHVGEKGITECLLRVMDNVFRAGDPFGTQRDDMIWRYGQLMDTKLALKALGYMDHEESDPAASYPTKIHPDVAAYADRFPAGTESLDVADKAFQIMSRNQLWKYYPDMPVAQRIFELAEKVKADRVSYHLDCTVLKVSQLRADLTPEERAEIGAIVHAIVPNSELAQSRGIPDKYITQYNENFKALRQALEINNINVV